MLENKILTIGGKIQCKKNCLAFRGKLGRSFELVVGGGGGAEGCFIAGWTGSECLTFNKKLSTPK